MISDESDPDHADESERRRPGSKEHKLYLPDRFTKMVQDDHKSNQVLHDTVRLFDDVETADFMASHSPGVAHQKGAPRHHVEVTFVNNGMGHPMICKPVQTLIDENRVKITGIVRCSDDELTISLRPIERRVEPVTATRGDIPDQLVDEVDND